VPFAPYPLPPGDPALDVVATVLDPVLAPLEFGPGSTGESGDHASITFCRGVAYSTDDACVDLVIDLEKQSEWHIVDVRYWGFPSERWHLPFVDADLATQLAELARTLPDALATQ
jgi:hypothetical protein